MRPPRAVDPRALAAVEAARACVGTPFRHQGRTPGQGLDCVGLILVAAKAQGLSVGAPADYGRRPDRARLADELSNAGLILQPPARSRPADVLVFSIGRYPRHVALSTGSGMIHAWSQAGRVVEHGMSPDWVSRLAAVYRFPGLY